MNERIIVADSDFATRSLIAGFCGSRNIAIWETDDAEIVPGLVERVAPKLIFLERSLPGATWYATLHAVARATREQSRIIIITAFPSNALAEEAEALGIQVLPKPVQNDVLARVVR